MDGVVAALLRADGIGAARIVRPGDKRVVLPLAVRAADRVDRREIKHVEAEVADIGELGDHIVESAVALRIVGHGAREKLVPGAEGGALAVDDKLQLARIARQVGADAGALHQIGGLARKQAREAFAFVLGRMQRGDEASERLLVGCAGAVASLQGALDEFAPLGQLERDRNPRGMLLRYLVAPAGEEVAPGDQSVAMARVLFDHGAAPPAVVVEEFHRRFAPAGLATRANEERGVDLVVAVGEDVGLNDEGVADCSLRRKTAPVDLRGDRFDDEPARGKRRERGIARPGRADCGGLPSPPEPPVSPPSQTVSDSCLARGLIEPFSPFAASEGRSAAPRG